ncbi:hypothetical protein LINPERPRIM_LOCUS25762 [Linum perenne]
MDGLDGASWFTFVFCFNESGWLGLNIKHKLENKSIKGDSS